MATTLYHLSVLPKSWHTDGSEYLTHLPVNNGFDCVLIVADHMTRMAHFLPFTWRVIDEETANLFLHRVCILHGLPRVRVSDRDPNKFASGF
jgi:hypothetical protein